MLLRLIRNVLSLTLVLLAAGSVLAGSEGAKALKEDLFSRDKWHAVSPSWPGVMTFDVAKKQAVLAPMGSLPMAVSYKYKVTKKDPKTNTVKGVLTFRLTPEQKSDMTFTLVNDKELTLDFKQGQRQEIYKRMSLEEIARYRQMIRDTYSIPSDYAPIP